jgi:hypothetical protein
MASFEYRVVGRSCSIDGVIFHERKKVSTLLLGGVFVGDTENMKFD